MDITVFKSDAIYQAAGLGGLTRNFDCEVICTTACDPETGEESKIILIHDIEENAVISIEASPILQAIAWQTAKEELRKGK